jgi:hypothetical protein
MSDQDKKEKKTKKIQEFKEQPPKPKEPIKKQMVSPAIDKIPPKKKD